jgi:hypothetical protein
MMVHEDLVAASARYRIDELIEEASRYRLAAALRRGRRQLWPGSLSPKSQRSAGPDAVVAGAGAEKKQAEKKQAELVGAVSRLAPCDGQQTSPRGAEEPVGTV